MTRVEGFGDGLGGKDADAGWEGAVEGVAEIFGRNVACEPKTGHLGEGVNAGVCATGALWEDGFAGDLADGFGQCALDGRKAGLDLPTVEVGAVVTESELPVRHKGQKVC